MTLSPFYLHVYFGQDPKEWKTPLPEAIRNPFRRKLERELEDLSQQFRKI